MAATDFAFKDKKILIVDDQRPFQLILKGMLFNLNARNMHFATTGEAALQKCMEIDFDILFVDYNLGTGKNGRQLLEDLRFRKRLKASAVFIIVTGENTRPMVMGALEREPDDYLVKPFSQGTLATRLARAIKRNEVLSPIYEMVQDELFDEALSLCESSKIEHPRYRQYISKLQAELFGQLGRYAEAEQVLLQELNIHATTWAQICLGQIKLKQQAWQEAIDIATKTITDNPFLVEAYDIQSQGFMALAMEQDAFASLGQALQISPFSMERQQLFCQVARNIGDFNSCIAACQTIMELNRRSAQSSINPVLDYLRALLDGAQHSEEAKQRNQYKQEAMLTVQRVKRDEHLFRELDYSTFEQMFNIRLDVMEGYHLKVKRALLDLQQKGVTPDALLPDSIEVLLNIGEFEAAQLQAEQLDISNCSALTQQLLQNAQNTSQERRQQFSEFNRAGIAAYKAGEFQSAITAFEQALHVAPMNTGSALNLIQACLTVIGDSKDDKAIVALKEKCRKAFRIVEDIALPKSHQERYQELRKQYLALVK